MKPSEELRQVKVLLVEDDPDDVEITRRAFERGRIANPLYIVRDGEEALEFLQHTGRYEGCDGEAPRPGLILLDLNLPRVDGREVLRQIKQDAQLRRIPVVVLTTSSEDDDVMACYDDGANTYITKPVEFDKFIQAVITIGQYWLSVAEIPDGT
ncbi:MAG: response regulator [Candidatus Brocadiia bacterium]